MLCGRTTVWFDPSSASTNDRNTFVALAAALDVTGAPP
jgi:hypothetical protein